MKISSKHIFGIFAFILSLSLIHWAGDNPFPKSGVAEAKITQEASDIEKETVVLDKDNPKIQKVMEVQNRHTPKLLAETDVVGTATGVTDDNRPAILVFTKKMLKAGAIPESLEGIPVIAKVTGEILAMNCPPDGSEPTDSTVSFPRPVPIGISTGNVGECSSGTIGARVTDGVNVYALSNNHVYALENDAFLNSQVLQPGRYDTLAPNSNTRCYTNTQNAIGTLYSYVPIIFNTPCKPPKITAGCNIADAAIALSSKAQLCNYTPINGYGKPSSTTVVASLKQAVKKYGRTTQLTRGNINGINATVKVGYGTSGKAIFVNQITVGSPSAFILAGDSGSLLVTNDDYAYPIGLLFAGNQSGTFAIANPIIPVLSSFGVTIDGK